MKYLVLFLFSFFLFSCSEEESELIPPEDVLSRQKFTSVMIDVQLVEGMKVHKLGPKRDRRPDMGQMYSEIFEKHGIGKEEFVRTYDFYKSHPKEMETIYEQVLDSLSKLDVEVKKEYNQAQKASRDSISIDPVKPSDVVE